MITFLEPRTLTDGSTVAAGEERSFDQAEEEAFVANGVAVFPNAPSTPDTGQPEEEVENNG